MENLMGKVAIVTGSSRGIGRGIAERLGRDGASVVVNHSNSEREANEVALAIAATGGKSIVIQADLSKVEDVRRLFARTILFQRRSANEHFGQLDIPINNAGMVRVTPIATVTEEDYDKMFNLNVRGTLFALQEAAKSMRDSGRIVNISASATLYPEAGLAVYAGSKSAVKLFTQVMAKEVGNRGITVNTVSPGATRTGMYDHFPPEFKQQLAASSPFNRVGTPQDIADIVAFLVSEEARWVSGQEICANGGAKS
jgi:3-oxoacyl-[acyl-carrier protein] reductase